MLQLRTAGKIHHDAGGADHEIDGNLAAWRAQLDAVDSLSRRFDRRAFVQMERRMPGAAIVGRLRKSLPQFKNGAHEAPAPGIVELGEMPEEAAEGQPTIRLHQLDR